MLYIRRQSKTGLDKKVALTILRRYGIVPDNICRTGISYTNDVFKVLYDNSVYFLKFFTDQWCDPDAGSNEVGALKKLAEFNIPVPNVLFYNRANDISPRNYSLMESLEGSALINRMPYVSSSLIEMSLDILDKFSQIKGPFGFFKHNPQIHRTYDLHHEFINDSVLAAFKKLKNLGYDLRRVPDLFSKFSKETNAREYSFCHNDFTPKHIFVDDQGITGLIDFEWSTYSKPLSDATLWLTSLAEYETPQDLLQMVLDHCYTRPEVDKLPYYTSRNLIFAAAWPHKNIYQPYFSQTCLDKAEIILANNSVKTQNLIWPEGTGILKVEKG